MYENEFSDNDKPAKRFVNPDELQRYLDSRGIVNIVYDLDDMKFVKVTANDNNAKIKIGKKDSAAKTVVNIYIYIL